MNEPGCVSIKLPLTESGRGGWIWPVGCSLLACGRDHQPPEELRETQGPVSQPLKDYGHRKLKQAQATRQTLGISGVDLYRVTPNTMCGVGPALRSSNRDLLWVVNDSPRSCKDVRQHECTHRSLQMQILNQTPQTISTILPYKS